MSAFINGAILPSPSSSDDDGMVIVQSQRYNSSLEHALMIGAIFWEGFRKHAERWGGGRSYMITFQSPFSLLYLALKAWFNSVYWDEGKFKKFRDQTQWDQMFYKFSLKFCGDSVEQMVLAINLYEYEPQGVYHYLRSSEFYNVLSYIPNQKRFKFKDL